jgi:hypothetical protein
MGPETKEISISEQTNQLTEMEERLRRFGRYVKSYALGTCCAQICDGAEAVDGHQ